MSNTPRSRTCRRFQGSNYKTSSCTFRGDKSVQRDYG
jgi:predicted RNA-binding Zn-ribbon protein involved in translation (DUF1610 family)